MPVDVNIFQLLLEGAKIFGVLYVGALCMIGLAHIIFKETPK